MEFRERIKDLRDTKKLTPSQLGAAMGKSEGAVRSWETGKAKPDADTLIKLSEYFGCTTDYLLGRSDIANPEKVIAVSLPLFGEMTASHEEIEGLCQDYFKALGAYATLPNNEKPVFSDILKLSNKVINYCKVVGEVNNLIGQHTALIQLHEASAELIKLLAMLMKRTLDKYCEMNGGKPKTRITWSSKPLDESRAHNPKKEV